MQRFEKILFIADPIADAGPALRRAVRLARSNEGQLTIATVGKEIPASLSDIEEELLRLQEEKVQALIAEHPVQGLTIATLHLTGTPFLQIVKEVLRNKHDLVIKPTEGRGGIASMLFGSTDMHLLRKCPCPVWVIKPSKKKKYARILAAVDPDPNEKAGAELNKLILDLATALAYRDKSELHIVHAWTMSHEATLRSGRAQLPKSDVDRWVRDTRKAHKKWLAALLGDYDLESLSVKAHLQKGEPGEVIPAVARKKRVELIVMGTVARTGIPGFFIGNAAEKTLAEVDCSVLAVKPKAFSTPIEV